MCQGGAVKGKEALRRRADILRGMELTGYMQLINQTFIKLRAGTVYVTACVNWKRNVNR